MEGTLVSTLGEILETKTHNKKDEEDEIEELELLEVAEEEPGVEPSGNDEDLLRLYSGLDTSLEQDVPVPPADACSDNLKSIIASSFINSQLESFLLKFGSVPENPVESCIGVGFVDIVDYSYLSSWLSPRENQRLLNGLYAAFNLVLRKRGGYLNKISGDSLMFHFGGMIDPRIAGMAPEDAEPLIARLLFLTCIEIQESCRLFNRADEDFIIKDIDPHTRRELAQAFLIIRNLRENLSLVSSISNMFQTRIRIGASIGDVCIGMFGPEGAKQWDVIGVPVIEARRMESSAPIDGLRISSRLMDVLRKTGLFEQYHEYFKSRASGFYQVIRHDELFEEKDAVLFEKKRAIFKSCVIQANPDLPEDVWRQIEVCLEKEERGIESMIQILKYYRGNRLVIHAIEELLKEREIKLRKAAMFKFLLPKGFKRLVGKNAGDEAKASDLLENRLSLYQLFRILGKLQDSVKNVTETAGSEVPFTSWNEWIEDRDMKSRESYRAHHVESERHAYFQKILFPGFFAMIQASFLEYFAVNKSKSQLPNH